MSHRTGIHCLLSVMSLYNSKIMSFYPDVDIVATPSPPYWIFYLVWALALVDHVIRKMAASTSNDTDPSSPRKRTKTDTGSSLKSPLGATPRPPISQNHNMTSFSLSGSQQNGKHGTKSRRSRFPCERCCLYLRQLTCTSDSSFTSACFINPLLYYLLFISDLYSIHTGLLSL